MTVCGGYRLASRGAHGWVEVIMSRRDVGQAGREGQYEGSKRRRGDP